VVFHSCRLSCILFPVVDACWWTWNQPRDCWHCYHLWLWLESTQWHSGLILVSLYLYYQFFHLYMHLGILNIELHWFLPVQRYASVSICHGNSVCLCVCLCVCALYQNGCMDRADFFARRFPLTYTTMYFNEIMAPPKIRVVPSRTLSQSLDLENFTTARRWSASEIQWQQAVCWQQCTWRQWLAGMVSVAYSIGPRPLADCLSHVM